jgi:hypothetical protein
MKFFRVFLRQQPNFLQGASQFPMDFHELETPGFYRSAGMGHSLDGPTHRHGFAEKQ